MKKLCLHEYEHFDNVGQAMQAFFASVFYLTHYERCNVMWMFNFIRNLYIDYLHGDDFHVSD